MLICLLDDNYNTSISMSRLSSQNLFLSLVHALFGIATYVPGFNRLRGKKSGGTDSARYCYSVWLRHLVTARKQGMENIPTVIAELGPGDSLGIGLSALLSGAEKYYAFDVVSYANEQMNERIFAELIELFSKQEPIPNQDEFPRIKPYLDCYDFPIDFLPKQSIEEALHPDRINKIKNSINNHQANESCIEYMTRWFDVKIQKESIDFIYSQAVLEHVDEIEGAYHSMYNWLRSGGYISHQVDFKSHGLAKEWYGHWLYSDWLWRAIRGNRPYLLNRLPLSSHIKFIENCQFHIKHCKKHIELSAAPREKLAQRFRYLPDEDLSTSGAYILASKN